MFFIFLLFSVQLLLGLWFRTYVSDLTLRGAHRIAARAHAGSEQTMKAEADLVANHVRERLKGHLIVAYVVPPDDGRYDEDYVTFVVVTSQPRFTTINWMGSWGTEDLERTAKVRRERVQTP